MSTVLQKTERYADQCEFWMLSALVRFPYLREELLDGSSPLERAEFAKCADLFDAIHALHSRGDVITRDTIVAHMEPLGFWFDDGGKQVEQLFVGPIHVIPDRLEEYRRGMKARWLAREYQQQNRMTRIYAEKNPEPLPPEHWEKLNNLAQQVRDETARAYGLTQAHLKDRRSYRPVQTKEDVMAKSTTKESSKEKQAPEVPDEQIDAFLAAVEPEERDTLRRCTIGQLKGLSTREGSRTWEKAQREVVANLINAGMKLKEIEWSEE